MIKRIYVVHHTHVDIGYTDIQTKLYEDHKKFIDSALDYCRQTDRYPQESKFRWTCEVSWTVKNYLEKCRPGKVKEFIKRVKEGRIEITGIYLNLTELYSCEELIRSVYFAKELEKKYGVKICSAMNSDVPGLSWAMPQILGSAGIKYLSMSANDYRSFQVGVPSPFFWVSPDGSRVLTWYSDSLEPNSLYGKGYGLGFNRSYEDVSKKLPEYLKRLEDEKYPYDACCVRFGADNTEPQAIFPRIAREWNEKHKSPKIIVSTNKEFFEYMERKYKDKIPSYKLAWPDWWADGNGSAAYEAGLSRTTDRDLGNIEELGSILSLLSKDYPLEKIKRIWDNLSFFDEHTWGARTAISYPFSLQPKAQWAIKSGFMYSAAEESGRLLNELRNRLSNRIRISEGKKIVVFNPLPYEAGNIASFEVPPEALKEMGDFQIKDGKSFVPYQVRQLQEKRGWGLGAVRNFKASFFANDIPPLGYRTFEIVSGRPAPCEDNFSFTGNGIENNFYKITLNPVTGGIKSILDKELKKELVDQKSKYGLNQYIYEEIVSPGGRDALYDSKGGCSGEKRRDARFRRTSPVSCRIRKGRTGPVTGSLIVETKARGCSKIVQEIILYKDLKRITMINTISKEENIEPNAVYYAFPFNFKKPEIKFEIAGAVVRPEIDQLRNSAKDYYSIQNWVSAARGGCSVVWVSKEAPLVQFSGINTGKWITEKLNVNNGSIFSWIMNNYHHTNFKISQSGEESFHYSITSCKGKVMSSAADRFAKECLNSFASMPVCKNPKGSLPQEKWSFFSLDKKNVTLLAVKKADDGKGIIIRLREIEGKDTALNITFPYVSVRKAALATITEEKIKPVRVGGKTIKVQIRKFGIVTLRVDIKRGVYAGKERK